MAVSGYLVMAGLVAGSVGLFFLAWAWAARSRRGRVRKGAGAGGDPLARRLEQRMETIDHRSSARNRQARCRPSAARRLPSRG